MHAGRCRVGRVRVADKLKRKQKQTVSYGSGRDAGHVPDTAWSGVPAPYCWQDEDAEVNHLVGSYSGKYMLGYKPTGFYYAGINKDPASYQTQYESGTVSVGSNGVCQIARKTP